MASTVCSRFSWISLDWISHLANQVHLRVGVLESLLKLALRLDPSIFHIFEVIAHVLHLVLELAKVLVFSSLGFNHVWMGLSIISFKFTKL